MLFTAVRARAPAVAADPGVLNPSLYHAMCRLFPGVRVTNTGQPVEGFYQTDPQTQQRRLRVVRWGEGYTSSCPYCGDGRDRLTISHLFGVLDPQTGFRGLELWKCYNEECQHHRENRNDLATKLLYSNWQGPQIAMPQVTITPLGDLPPCQFPGSLVRLTDLPANHRVATYLRDERGFDLQELDDVWEVAYADHVPARSRGASSQDRIIIPVRSKGVQVGWQARYPGELDWKKCGVAKYLTFYPKTRALYGLDKAAGHDPVVLFEGCTDVWRYGPGAVCIFGPVLGGEQPRLLAAALGQRTLILVPDADDPRSQLNFFESAGLVRDKGFLGKIGLGCLPRGTDPARLSQPQLRATVQHAVQNAFS